MLHSRASEAAWVAKVLRRWRATAGLRREEVATRVARSVATVQRWEHGASQPRVSDVRALERVHAGLVAALFGRPRA